MDSNFWKQFMFAIKKAKERPFIISSRKAAEQIGISASTFSRIENGLKPDADTLIKICTWLSKNKKHELTVDIFSEDNIQDLVGVSFNDYEESIMYETINKIIYSVSSLNFSGIFTFKNEQYFYIKVSSINDKLLKEVCRRLQDYGKWETIVLKMNNSTFSSSSNAICIHKKDFNPTNKQAEFL